MFDGLTVLVVDRDQQCRDGLVTALRRLGLRALGLTLVEEAVGLLDGIDVEIVLVHAAESPAVEVLRRRTPLVVVTHPEASIEDTVVELLRALGRPEEAAHLN